LYDVDLIVTDPPYRTISGGTKSKLASGWKTSVLKDNDGRIFEHNDIGVDVYVPLLHDSLKDGGDAYVMTNNLNLSDLLVCAEEVGFGFHNLVLWIKNTCTANRWYMKNVEYVCYFYKSPARRINDAGSKQTFYADNPTDKLHPTEKPVSLFSYLIGNSSNKGDLALDPFMGSGASGVSCVQLGRRYVGIEIDENYYEVAKENILRALMQPTLL
jgi:DNA modification methylase